MTGLPSALVLGDGDMAVQFYLDFGHELDVKIDGFIQDHHPESGEGLLEGLPVYTPETAARLAATHRIFSVMGRTPRGAFIERVEQRGFDPIRVIHSGAVVSPHCMIGEGSCVYPLVGIAARAQIGRHVLIARNAVVGHNTVVGDYSTISSGCMVPGHVTIGPDCYLGMGAVLVDHVSVGAGSTVGAGAVVTRDVPPGVTVVGNPARILEK